NGGAFSDADYYVYSWSGTNAPTPDNTLEHRVVYDLPTGNHTLTVTTSVDGCESDDATTEIIVNANNQPYTEWNGNIDTDWFHPMNWTDCRPGPDSEAHIPRNVVTVRYPVVTNI